MRRKDIVDYHHEPVFHTRKTGMFSGVRRYKLEEVLDPQEVSGGWEQTLVFASVPVILPTTILTESKV